MANTLFDLAQAYLNQGMPSISPIFQSTPPSSIGPIVPVETDEPVVDSLLPRSGGNEEGFSVYNPDPNMTRTSRNYVNPFSFDPMDNFGTSDYGYPGSPRTGVMGLYDQYKDLPMGSKAALGAGSLMTGGQLIPAALGVYGAGKLIGGMLPPNRRGILENELLGAGVMLDNTGRVVTNDYSTPEGIMAGYNAAKITDKTFDKRRDTIVNTLSEKYGLSQEEIEQALAGTYTGPVQTDLLGRLITLNEAQNLFNKRNKVADAIFQSKLDKKEEKQRAEEAAFAAAGGNRAAQERQRQRDQARIDRAYREDTGPGPGSYGPGGGSGIQRDSRGRETGYNDPFDPGGGEKDGGFIDGSNRRPFAYGGLASIL